jgi:hypothetical protein
MWQTIAIAVFLHGINAGLFEPAPYYASSPHRVSEPLVDTDSPKASDTAAKPSRPVVLQLSVYEISLTKLRRLGFEGTKVAGDSIERFDMDKLLAVLEGNSGKAGGQLVQPGQATFGFNVMEEKDVLNESLKALSKNGLAKVLAAPTLMTMSGHAASLHIGGEFAIPSPKGKGNTPTQFKKYGTMVDCNPTILNNGRIRLELRAEVAELDREHSVVIAGQTVPGVQTSMVDTTCEMKSGQVVVLGGLHERRPAETPAGADKEKTQKAGPDQPNAKPATEEMMLLFTVKAEIVRPADGKGKAETGKRAGDGKVMRR